MRKGMVNAKDRPEATVGLGTTGGPGVTGGMGVTDEMSVTEDLTVTEGPGVTEDLTAENPIVTSGPALTEELTAEDPTVTRGPALTGELTAEDPTVTSGPAATEIPEITERQVIVDAHCDLLIQLLESKQNIFKNRHHADIERMRKYGGYVQFFAACINPSYGREYSIRWVIQALDMYFVQEDMYKDVLALCRNLDEIEKTLKMKKVAAILAVEGGDVLQGDLSVLRLLYRLGVRCMTLTWNYRNEIADGVLDETTGGGLTPFGRDVIKEMNRLGMLIDLSHISERGFWDAVELSGGPVILSHSNARKLCSHVRNVTDEQLAAIRRNNGVVCVNFYPPFLNDSGKAGITDIIRHIEHMAGLIGIEHIGLGSDFDGIEILPEGMHGVQDVSKVLNELQRLNYPREAIEKIAGGNVLRVIGEVCLP